MPELPDILLYVDALRSRIVGRPIERIRVLSPFVVRSVDPPIDAVVGSVVEGIRRLGKRIVLELGARPDADLEEKSDPFGPPRLFLVFHLMIAGRFRWLKAGGRPPGKIALATFEFPNGTLALTEAGTKKRASLYLLAGESELRAHDPGGTEVLDCDLSTFRETLRRENHTLKRALTDPRLFSGIGNAYSDEILHAAHLSPVTLTSRLSDEQVQRLHAAVQETLTHWIEKLRTEFGGRFPGPGEITAFRPDFAVHGRYGEPCPKCGETVQRIRYAANETNYCPGCQTNGRILADRSLSRLLKDDWPG